jgi:SAM-dependent methyltransferase
MIGEELFARATDPDTRTMGYWSISQFSLYAVAASASDPTAAARSSTARAQHPPQSLPVAPASAGPPPSHAAAGGDADSAYATRLTAQLNQYSNTLDIHELPAAFHYWSTRYLGPKIENVFGSVQAPAIICDAWLRNDGSGTTGYSFASIGAGDCSVELTVARQLIDRGVDDFTITAFELSPALLGRARSAIEQQGLERHFHLVECDINHAEIKDIYDGVMAHYALHHFMNLEGIFDNVKRMLRANANFVVWDIIGRNGHMRWPEALSVIEHLWAILPSEKKFNRLLQEAWPKFVNHDCSSDGFEGIRSQDILPALLERFYASHFVVAGGITEIFLDRAFGHNFDPDNEWDRGFIDLIEHLNTRLLDCGALKPTMMYAVFTNERCECRHERHLTPEFCVRQPTAPPDIDS